MGAGGVVDAASERALAAGGDDEGVLNSTGRTLNELSDSDGDATASDRPSAGREPHRSALHASQTLRNPPTTAFPPPHPTPIPD